MARSVVLTLRFATFRLEVTQLSAVIAEYFQLQKGKPRHFINRGAEFALTHPYVRLRPEDPMVPVLKILEEHEAGMIRVFLEAWSPDEDAADFHLTMELFD